MVKALGTGIKWLGTGIRMLGGVCLFLAAIVGVLALDAVILSLLTGGRGGSNSNFIFTPLVVGIFVGTSDLKAVLLTLFVASIINTIIGIIVACTLGMPMIAAFLVAAWGGAIAITMLGVGIEALGRKVMLGSSSAPSSYVPPQASNSYQFVTGALPQNDDRPGNQDRPVMGVPVEFPGGSQFPPAQPPVDHDYDSGEKPGRSASAK
jgi:hypothetical protein